MLQLLEFTLKFNLSAQDAATWIYILLVFVVFVIVVGFVWGKLWNREWSLGSHIGSLALIIFFAVCAAYAVFNLRGISRMETWFQAQRTSLSKSITDSGVFNRAVLRSTWEKLAPAGGQASLTPPNEGGNEIRLNNPEEALLLAENAATEARTALRTKLPFSLGIPISYGKPAEIATEAVDAVNFGSSRFPTIVPSNNEWVSTAATIQTNQALDAALNALKPGLADLKLACIVLLIASIGIPILTIPFRALNDIKVNPRV